MRAGGVIGSYNLCHGFLVTASARFEPAKAAISCHDTAFRPLVHQFYCSLREFCIAACQQQPQCAATHTRRKTLSTRYRCKQQC